MTTDRYPDMGPDYPPNRALRETCDRSARCVAPPDSGHYCPASPEQVRKLGYPEPVQSPFTRRALAGELPAKATAR